MMILRHVTLIIIFSLILLPLLFFATLMLMLLSHHHNMRRLPGFRHVYAFYDVSLCCHAALPPMRLLLPLLFSFVATLSASPPLPRHAFRYGALPLLMPVSVFAATLLPYLMPFHAACLILLRYYARHAALLFIDMLRHAAADMPFFAVFADAICLRRC